MASSRRRSEPSTHTSSRIPWQTKRTHPWIILSFSCSATALNLYNSDFAVVASRAWTVSTVPARLDEMLVGRQIDAVLAIGRHRVARRPSQLPNRVSGVDPEELEDELDIECASVDHLEEMELRELSMMRLPSCVMALAVSEMVP